MRLTASAAGRGLGRFGGRGLPGVSRGRGRRTLACGGERGDRFAGLSRHGHPGRGRGGGEGSQKPGDQQLSDRKHVHPCPKKGKRAPCPSQGNAERYTIAAFVPTFAQIPRVAFGSSATMARRQDVRTIRKGKTAAGWASGRS